MRCPVKLRENVPDLEFSRFSNELVNVLKALCLYSESELLTSGKEGALLRFVKARIFSKHSSMHTNTD